MTSSCIKILFNLCTPLFSGNMTSTKTYVILLGKVGAGKSNLVEKLTGRTEMSSAASTSATKMSGLFETADFSMIICDTPGTDCISDQFQCNLDIVHALNFFACRFDFNYCES